jgi:hypothetical protein
MFEAGDALSGDCESGYQFNVRYSSRRYVRKRSVETAQPFIILCRVYVAAKAFVVGWCHGRA